MSSSKMSGRCLFGGAMLAAGLVSGPASAQTFSFAYHYASVEAYDASDRDPFDILLIYDSGFLSTGVANSAGRANMAFSPRSITLDVTSYTSYGANGVASGYIAYTHFSPTEDTTLDISWDFSASVDAARTWFQVRAPDGDLIFYADQDDPVGSVQMPVYAGIGNYTLSGWVVATDGNGTSWYLMVIPTPSSGALLALGGLIAMRRRR